jgi:hypothetical protein
MAQKRVTLANILETPKESAVWEFIFKDDTVTALRGNAKATCKCCGKTQTTSPGSWWTHVKEACNGSKDPELLEHAQVAADKHFAAAAKRTSSSRSAMIQTSMVKLSEEQLHAQADEAIARWAFATGQSLRAVDDYFFRDALEKMAAAGPKRKHLGRKRLKEQMKEQSTNTSNTSKKTMHSSIHSFICMYLNA